MTEPLHKIQQPVMGSLTLFILFSIQALMQQSGWLMAYWFLILLLYPIYYLWYRIVNKVRDYLLKFSHLIKPTITFVQLFFILLCSQMLVTIIIGIGSLIGPNLASIYEQISLINYTGELIGNFFSNIIFAMKKAPVLKDFYYALERTIKNLDLVIIVLALRCALDDEFKIKDS
jgi:hypothetical protein